MKHLVLILILCLCVTTVLAQSESYTLKFYDTTKVDPKVRNKDFTVKIGDSKEAQFDPSFAITAWRGECKFRINLSTAAHPMNGASKSVTSLNGRSRVTLSTASVDHDMFAVEDGFEWYIILNEKPDTNVFTYDIETENLVYLYQYDSLGLFEVPDSVNGSYVAYHSTKRDCWKYVSPKDTTYENYMTGIAFTIFRPKAWDAIGKDITWCLLYVDLAAEKLSVSVPQKFLDDAVYPVVIDPTFGYESIGTLAPTSIVNVIIGWTGAPSSSGTLDSISAYIDNENESNNVHCATYKTSDTVLVDSSEEISVGVGVGWVVFDLLLDGQIYADTNYAIVVQGEASVPISNCRIWFNITGNPWAYESVAYGAWPDPWTGMTTTPNRDVSIYAYYTVPVAAGQVMFINQ